MLVENVDVGHCSGAVAVFGGGGLKFLEKDIPIYRVLRSENSADVVQKL